MGSHYQLLNLYMQKTTVSLDYDLLQLYVLREDSR